MSNSSPPKKPKPREWYLYAVISRHGNIIHLASSDRPPHRGETKINVRITEIVK